MTRSILIVIAVGVFLDIVAGSGCAPGGIGDPCIPDQEYDTCFAGFAQGEVNTESRSFQCQTRLCLVNHFQGRVSCPYGQTAMGTAPLANCPGNPAGGEPFVACDPPGGLNDPSFTLTDNSSPSCVGKADPCTIPGGATVLGSSSSTVQGQYAIQVSVPPQLTPRQTANAVYCSCRCENDMGQTNDGEVYCQCPSGFSCEQLVFPTTETAGSNNLTGGYCVKDGTSYSSSFSAASENKCNPTMNPCP